MSTTKLSFKLNGQSMEVVIKPNTLLIDLLRDDLGLTGTKAGCREGECGACTVLLDGEPVNSCILPAFKVAGRSLTTIEGLANEEGDLEEIQQAFMDEGAAQCGFCTPGMIMNAKALLDKNPKPDEAEIRQSLSGVLCRCTGYRKIVQAVVTASQMKKSQE
ncbi:MAG: (2Fe-2S)-binding protein [Deltaproteobacteria bacterium]|nr:(2Fe-2S)-binding protein [Deltaproteobacteria bacterium]MBW2048374.1 (2Fe-2S)-binding protein [Deltaproteobacteria bacterium]